MEFSSENPKAYNIKEQFPAEIYIEFVNDTIFLFTLSGVNYYDRELDSFY